MRFDEIYELIETNKSMQNELIEQKFNSQKALLTAQLMKEHAERVSGDEMMGIKVNKHEAFIKESQELLYQIQNTVKDQDMKASQNYESLKLQFNNSFVNLNADVDQIKQEMTHLNEEITNLA